MYAFTIVILSAKFMSCIYMSCLSASARPPLGDFCPPDSLNCPQPLRPMYNKYTKMVFNLLIYMNFISPTGSQQLKKEHQNIYTKHIHADVKCILSTPCPRKKQATLIFDITSPSVEIFLHFLKHLVQE